MRITVEFRVGADDAKAYLPNGSFSLLPSGRVARVKTEVGSALYNRLRELHREARSNRKLFCSSWEFTYHYDREELDSARLFHLSAKRFFEPSGEECGTRYLDAEGCPQCGAGPPRIGELKLRLSSVPKRVDLASTISYNERVVSARFVQVVREHGLRGIEFGPVHSPRGGVSEVIFEPIITGGLVDVHPTTVAGQEPFFPDRYGPCPRGDTIGLALLSPLRVCEGTLADADFMMTRQYVGHRMGVLQPKRMFLVSQRAYRAFQESQLKGLRLEIAEVV